MFAITVQQPWASAIVHGSKNVENRAVLGTWRRAVGRRVAIHAGLAWSAEGARRVARLAGQAWCDDWYGPAGTVPRGVVVGTVRVVDLHHADDCRVGEVLCSRWAEPGVAHLMLRDPIPLERPVPARGVLGLWTLPAEVLEVVRAGSLAGLLDERSLEAVSS